MRRTIQKTAFRRLTTLRARALAVPLLTFFCTFAAQAQQPDEASVVRGIDAAVKSRFDGIASYTVIEHYAVFRNNDERHSVAEMTVRTSYQRATGKNYAVLSASGSDLIRRLVLNTILDNEKRINAPGVRESSWINSANYRMRLNPEGIRRIDGRDCFEVFIDPKQKAPNLIAGSIWVDVKDNSIVLLQGTASKSVSHFTGPTYVMRQYTNVQGFAMATHARATSNSMLFGQTVVTIDYADYRIQLSAPK